MHDLDHTLGEAEAFGDLDELEMYESAPSGDDFDDGFDDDGPLDDATETELAAELLAVTDEDELEIVLERAMQRPRRRGRRRRPSPQGQQVRKKALGLLKQVAKKALPGIGAAVGGMVPIVGPAVGRAVGRAAAKAIHPELEHLGPSDLEFETARKVVKLASEAGDNVEQAPPDEPPAEAANAAVVGAARKHAPRLVRRKGGAGRGERRGEQGGRWIRRGRNIVILGA